MSGPPKNMTRRLIENWLPIAALGEESVRERRSMTALPPTYYLHVWWARRPLVASRAAILASLLPEDADHDKFLRVLGIHGDPIAAQAHRRGQAEGRALRGGCLQIPARVQLRSHAEERAWITGTSSRRLGLNRLHSLDPTAGGGSIPFESARLGLTTAGNDLNPVAVLDRAGDARVPAPGIGLKRWQTSFAALAD